jgi:putative ABC transport system permease protein
MQSLLASLRYSLRLLRKSPGFTITAVLILGFGIGANTAIFSLIDYVLLKPPPYPRPERMVNVSMPSEHAPDGFFDYPDYLDYVASQHTLSALGLSVWEWLDVTKNGNAERIKCSFETASSFQAFELPIIIGRSFTAEEEQPGGPLLAVISEPFWRTHFYADPKIIGQNVVLNGYPFQIIGVSQPINNEYNDPPNILLPINTVDVVCQWGNWRGRDNHSLFCVGRLKDGVTLAQAQADLEVIQRNLVARYPEDKGYGIRVDPTYFDETKPYSAALWLLIGAATGLLLISTINVATLLLARASDRQREMMIRTAIGASRFRMIIHSLFESALLSLIGGLFAIPVALLGIEFIKRLSPEDMPGVIDLSLNPEVLGVFFIVAMLTALASGLFPALISSNTNAGIALRGGGDRGVTAGPQHRQAQSTMMIGQISLTCVLLIGTGLLVRSFQAAQDIPLGFDPHNVLMAEIHLANKKYRDQSQADSLFAALLEKARQLPGVTAAALSDNPFCFIWFHDWGMPFNVPGQPLPEPGHEPRLNLELVAPGYFNAMRISLIEGRDFDESDKRPSNQRFQNPGIIISRALAEAFFSGRSPIGKQIELSASYMEAKTYTIIGVVENTRHAGLDQPSPKFIAFCPYYQHLTNYQVLILRSTSDPRDLSLALRKAVAAIDPDQPLGKVITLDDGVAQGLGARKLMALLVTIFSGASLSLSAVGLYGVLAYMVSRQTREIGVRIAIGALSWNILTLILKRGFTIVGLGIVIGLLIAVALSGFLGSLLYGVGSNDPVTVGLSILILCLATLVACLLPALRAIRINPVTALRE